MRIQVILWMTAKWVQKVVNNCGAWSVHEWVCILRVAGGDPRRPSAVKKTDVYIVPVDIDSPLRNLLTVKKVACAFALY